MIDDIENKLENMFDFRNTLSKIGPFGSNFRIFIFILAFLYSVTWMYERDYLHASIYILFLSYALYY